MTTKKKTETIPIEEAIKQAEAEIYHIVFSAVSIQRKDGAGSFMSYQGYNKNGDKFNLRLRKEVQPLFPQKEGDYLLHVDKRYISRDKQSKHLEYWVRQIESIDTIRVLDDDINTEDLPF